MIPIEYRLDATAESKYIAKVLSCIEQPADYSGKIKNLSIEMEKAGYSIGRKIQSHAKRFYPDYPDCCYLCIWLILSYEELTQIKDYLDNMITQDLERINMAAKHIFQEIKEIKSYHDLQIRRKRKYTTHFGVLSELNRIVNYDSIYDEFKKFTVYYDKFSAKGINGWIIEKTEMKVCPYCNISYTYNRGNTVTAQLDHFFPKSEYPIFALCFYNLIPSCPSCNKIKFDGMEPMASPYKRDAFAKLRITWDYAWSAEKNKYNTNNSLKALEEMIKIKIETSEEAEVNNISKMKIEEAYQNHTDYAGEIINKVKTYTNPDAQKLICNICVSAGITPDEVEQFYFGNYIKESELKRRPLSKMTRDFYEEYKKHLNIT